MTDTLRMYEHSLRDAFPGTSFVADGDLGRPTYVGWVDGPTVSQVTQHPSPCDISAFHRAGSRRTRIAATTVAWLRADQATLPDTDEFQPDALHPDVKAFIALMDAHFQQSQPEAPSFRRVETLADRQRPLTLHVRTYGTVIATAAGIDLTALRDKLPPTPDRSAT